MRNSIQKLNYYNKNQYEKKIVAGNWKMNNDQRETAELIAALKSIRFSTKTRVLIALPLPNFSKRSP